MSTNEKERPITDWLPITKKEMQRRNWDELDVILISGDAYVDHPSFGTAVIGRLIEREGLRIGIIPQPNWQDDLRDFRKFGPPRLFFGVTAGCMDSMVNKYTANKRLRQKDAYTPGGAMGFRPDYASIVYTKILKQIYPNIPVILGGIEASLRRVTHYDYWSDQLKASILYESGADLLIYGMGERPLLKILKLLKKNIPLSSLKTIEQTAFLLNEDEVLPSHKRWKTLQLHSHEECLADKKKFARNFKVIEQESNSWHARRLTQKIADKILVINPPFPPSSTKEIDQSFDLPFTRLPHPKYKKRGPIPAYEMIKFSVNLHRGCFGGCSFCTISAHQGKFISSRSRQSILKEVEQITKMKDFRGYISDLGGPSANMYTMQGKDLSLCQRCRRPSCIHPKICPNLDTSHERLLQIYREVRQHPLVKKAFIGSGIRYDLFLDLQNQKDTIPEYAEELITHHVSGRLKVAPEHTSDKVLRIMRKPSFQLFRKFKRIFDKINHSKNLNQQLIPYFISSHPNCDLIDMAELAVETKALGFKLEQVQDFTPTPMTLATVIYYSGFHPYTMQPIQTARTKEEKLAQRRFFFWYQPEHHHWIEKILLKYNRQDLLAKLLPPKMKKKPPKPQTHRKKRASKRSK